MKECEKHKNMKGGFAPHRCFHPLFNRGFITKQLVT